jgi:hypothetical protein
MIDFDNEFFIKISVRTVFLDHLLFNFIENWRELMVTDMCDMSLTFHFQ